jgi:putative membrane-bound dehydrogenase-like protein
MGPIKHYPFMKKIIQILALPFIIFLCSSSAGRRASDLEGIAVPEGYTLEVAAGPDLVDFPMFATVDEQGRLFVFESIGNVYEKTQDAITHPQFRIKLLQDINGDGIYDKSTVFADKIGFPQGGVFYKGSLYASSAPDLLKLTDTDGDGVADKREVILSGWVLNVNANSLVGPFMGPDGWLYMSSAIMGFDVVSREGKRLKGETARIWRLRPDGSGLEWISAGGMNNPVELTFTESAEVIGTETYFTDPKAGQRDALVYWTEGGVYPKPNKNIDRDSLVRTGELMPVISKYSRVAPSGIGTYRGTALGEDFRNNLFSAQFNTHRILRHKLIRDGASFRTEDEVFFEAESEDSHPTDVLEDGDGSLLVVETGGWFIKGCPLSQVSKPELKGKVYRIRKKGAPKMDDPFGNKIDWAGLSEKELITLLADKRPFVNDRAVQALVDKGESAVASLAATVSRSTSADVRSRAVFALYRIGSAKAFDPIRVALSDTSVQVSVAAARAVGLSKDSKAVEKLKNIVVQSKAPALRRQAATALGQIGDAGAVPALLSAAGTTDDRFIRHALIYAMVSINRPDLVKDGLVSKSPRIVDAALIALDQMPKSMITARQVIPYLTGKSETLQQTALWVISHHPEWSDDIQSYLSARFKKGILTAKEKESYKNILVSFSANASTQQFVADQVRTGTAEQQIFLLGAMSISPLKVFPPAWVSATEQLIGANNASEVKSAALDLVRLRNIKTVDGALTKLIDNPATSNVIKIEALSALLGIDPALSDKHFDYLFAQLKGKNETPVRLQVASTLGQARLSETQLLTLAKDYLPTADPFILPRLVPVFNGEHAAEAGILLARTLAQSTTLDSYSEENLVKLFAKYPDSIKPEVTRLLKRLNEVQAERLTYLRGLESTINQGNIENGRRLFFDKAACYACHTVGPEGGDLGPDLTSIQRDRSAHDLLEAIVYPSATFVREYETYKIKTRTNEYTGVIREKSPEVIVLNTSAQSSVRIARAEIVSIETVDFSMMPQGLDKSLTPQEMSDLMAFLLGQDQNPSTDKAFLR